MASVDLIRISVACEFGTWLTKYGDVVRTYESEGAAITAAISRAQAFGREGRFAAVVMRTLTSVYGPTGLIRTLPTRGRPTPEPEEPVAAEEFAILDDPAPSVAPTILEQAFEPVVRKPAARKTLVREPRAEKMPEMHQASAVENIDAISAPAEIVEPERPGRFMRIVAALAREAEDHAAAGRSFHQTISRLARSRRAPSLR